jgi:hypothetical protein
MFSKIHRACASIGSLKLGFPRLEGARAKDGAEKILGEVEILKFLFLFFSFISGRLQYLARHLGGFCLQRPMPIDELDFFLFVEEGQANAVRR